MKHVLTVVVVFLAGAGSLLGQTSPTQPADKASAGDPESVCRKDFIECLRITMSGTGNTSKYLREVAADHVAQWAEAASRGLPEGCHLMGRCYSESIVVDANMQMAVGMYRKAAAAGFAASMNNLGGMCSNGYGMPRDSNEAAR